MIYKDSCLIAEINPDCLVAATVHCSENTILNVDHSTPNYLYVKEQMTVPTDGSYGLFIKGV